VTCSGIWIPSEAVPIRLVAYNISSMNADTRLLAGVFLILWNNDVKRCD
jgi:hypothetical protein